MSEEAVPAEFWARADRVIDLANEQVKASAISKVSASLLYAAARFNAFNVASKAASVDDMKGDRDAAIEYFTGQYRRMFIENLDDYVENFAKYKPQGD